MQRFVSAKEPEKTFMRMWLRGFEETCATLRERTEAQLLVEGQTCQADRWKPKCARNVIVKN